MMFVLSVTPLGLGIVVVILALIRKLRPQPAAEESKKAYSQLTPSDPAGTNLNDDWHEKSDSTSKRLSGTVV